jgi:RimJ/RimL family protein N-acetyltransferase
VEPRLEIGYWVHADHLRRGIATEAARALTEVAFGVDGIERVEIHHDRANVRSRAVPARLGFTFMGESPDGARAPAEDGIDCTWTITASEWAAS